MAKITRAAGLLDKAGTFDEERLPKGLQQVIDALKGAGGSMDYNELDSLLSSGGRKQSIGQALMLLGRKGLVTRQGSEVALSEELLPEAKDTADKSDYELDQENIGTPKYKGEAFFWHWEFRHELRNMKPRQRKQVHDAWLKAGLGLNDYTQAHADTLRDLFGDKYWHEVKKPDVHAA